MTSRTLDSAQAELSDVLGPERLHEATEADAVRGVAPRWVARVSSTEQTSEVLRVAAAHQLRIVPRGGGSKLDWGAAPTGVDLVLDTSGTEGILEHASGDLVLRATAGTPLSRVRRTVAEAGQRLCVDHPLPGATLGGIVATASAGPCRQAFGTVRDLLIGITVVRADGEITASGGRVVKNVAGYDLGKLYTGSHGTLGVITETIFRLHPLAAEHRWVTLRVPDAGVAGAAMRSLRASQAVPTGIELDRPSPDAPVEVGAQLEGMPGATDQRAHELAERLGAELGVTAEVGHAAPEWWGAHPFDSRRDTGLRFAAAPADLARLLDDAGRAAEEAGTPLAVRGSAGAGVLLGGVPADVGAARTADAVSRLRAATAALHGHTTVLRAPAPVLELVDPWETPEAGVFGLMRRVKEQFDPEHRLAPGRFVGGL
ncbi:FAD-binding oxidoreductase [Actinopolyspora erythraea]|uniref:FAD-binding oxidoreductase n=1 Tax=Actinopolyspora erythraea TaxID=414996 RepID=A0A099D3Q2_9ACTN|nr:FAD-binding oxidoreductase [Actinopolyspora erythraea]ASU77752.1 FAD-binding oxidoreductase [Actinopolyspora erythraea]KGI79960.1 FAD-binding protein [Actinopolyspora erythraea]